MIACTSCEACRVIEEFNKWRTLQRKHAQLCEDFLLTNALSERSLGEIRAIRTQFDN